MIEILIMDDSSDKIESLKSEIFPIFQNGEIVVEVAHSLVAGEPRCKKKLMTY